MIKQHLFYSPSSHCRPGPEWSQGGRSSTRSSMGDSPGTPLPGQMEEMGRPALRSSSSPQAAEPRNPPKSLTLHPWPQTQLRSAATQLYLLLTGSPPSREIPSSCSKRLSVPFCPFSRKSFPLGRMRGAGRTWRALPKAGYGLGTGSRGPEVKSSF